VRNPALTVRNRTFTALIDDLVRDLDRAYDLNSDPALGLDRALDRARSRARALDRNLDQCRGPTNRLLALDLARYLDRVIARVLYCRDRNRVLYFIRYLVTVLRLLHDLNMAHRLGSGAAVSLALQRTRSRARSLVGHLEEARGLGVAREPERQVVVAGSARCLIRFTARMLPVAHRARYEEEYYAELWETAAAGADRWRQFAYGFRQLVRVLPLRRELTAPRRRKAAP
jgi:hypothetical protein